MRKNINFELTPGSYFEKSFSDYDSMLKATKVWGQICTYQLQADGFKEGHHKFLYLSHLLLSSASRKGSLYYDVIPPSDSISIVIIEECKDGKACFGKEKLHPYDILIFDSIHNFISTATMKFTIISISKIHLRKLNILDIVYSYVDKKLIDKDFILLKKIDSVFKSFKNDRIIKDENYYLKSEQAIIQTLLFSLQTLEESKQILTKGEIVALQIKKDLYKHLDKNITISSIVKTYTINERTLQKSFLSLFGLSPSSFIRALKLNHIYKELKESNRSDTTVSKTAFKWGYNHMGRFSAYYKELFGESPSVTLSKEKVTNDYLEEFCSIQTQ